MSKPKLRNDCFALPPGVDWTPVDEALARLKADMRCVVQPHVVPLEAALGRIASEDILARRDHPPFANSAVDGYAFAHADMVAATGDMPLAPQRAAAGDAGFTIECGTAARILTGAMVPGGCDTVVLQEDVEIDAGRVRFEPALRRGANLRARGEDLRSGDVVLRVGARISSGDIAMMASCGVDVLSVYAPLRVGVLSTGSEVVPHGSTPEPSQIFDANRPMLLSLLEQLRCSPVDLGHVRDDAGDVARVLDAAAGQVDAIVTTGGASAGDEDHISAALQTAGRLRTWRVAMKPGRPLALGVWDDVPVFGLPGNPVAAFVCALIFGAPALSVLGGGAWREPRGFEVDAGFEKDKKHGRSEYLRARIGAEGRAEVFASEGSGRVSGLAWADGLVCLGPEGRQIKPGDRVRYVPFSSWGLV
jgi:molybdopterin molybdotransferase